jgi:CRISPR-associated protein Csb2
VAVRDVVPVFVPVNDVAVVSMPDTTRLAAAEAVVRDTADISARVKAEREATKLKAKLDADTAKAISPSTKVSGAEVVAAAQLFPERRLRQPRTFPSVAPAVPTVAFVWPDAAPEATQELALGRLLARLVRLGHSSSFVHARIIDSVGVAAIERRTTRFVPDSDDGSLMLRWVGKGQADRLIREFARHRETEPRVLPAMFVRYRQGVRPPREPSESSLFGEDWIVFARVGGARLPSTATVGVARQLRRALMSVAPQPVSELLSGHGVDGAAGNSPHLAIVPLPFAGSKHADGAILGVGLVFPRDAKVHDRLAVLRAVGNFEATQPVPDADEAAVVALHLGTAGDLGLQRVVWGEHDSSSLRPDTWSRASCRWASTTPVALDRNPGDLHDPDPSKRRAAFEAAAEIVAHAVRRIGLPTPVELDVVRSCVLPGTAKPQTFPRFPVDSARAQRVLVHVRVVFGAPVRGPILLGAGRYHGLGLLRPLDGGDEARS